MLGAALNCSRNALAVSVCEQSGDYGLEVGGVAHLPEKDALVGPWLLSTRT